MSVYKDQISDQLQHRGEFAQIPNELWQVKNLSASAHRVWSYLSSEGLAWKSSYSNLARNTQMALNTARKAIKELQEKKMVAVYSNPEGCDFELLSSDKWDVEWTDFYKKRLQKAGATDAQGLCKKRTRARSKTAQAPVQNLEGIQKDTNTPNTFQYTDSLCSSGRVEKEHIEEFQDKKGTPEIVKPEASPEQKAKKIAKIRFEIEEIFNKYPDLRAKHPKTTLEALDTLPEQAAEEFLWGSCN